MDVVESLNPAAMCESSARKCFAQSTRMQELLPAAPSQNQNGLSHHVQVRRVQGHSLHVYAAARGTHCTRRTFKCTHASLKGSHVGRPQVLFGFYALRVQRGGWTLWDGSNLPYKDPQTQKRFCLHHNTLVLAP
jgi:hypothetical protein